MVRTQKTNCPEQVLERMSPGVRTGGRAKVRWMEGTEDEMIEKVVEGQWVDTGEWRLRIGRRH
jgi:hypothetical protein